LNGKKTVDVVESSYVDVTITLDELATYVTSGNGNFHSSTWLVYYQGEARIKDMSLAKVATVTYKDGENVLKTSVVEKGETITAMSMPGYDVVWMNGDTAFDFATPINGDITLTAVKTLKKITLTADSVITTAGGDTALTLDAEGGLGAKVNTSSSGGYSFKLNWKFNLTAEDIEAFKTMGYTHFTFKLYVWSSAKDFTTFTILNKTKTVDVVEGSYVDVTITLDELATYVTSGNGNFHSSTWLMYYQGSASIKDMTVVTL
jgi:hypothetical protein